MRARMTASLSFGCLRAESLRQVHDLLIAALGNELFEPLDVLLRRHRNVALRHDDSHKPVILRQAEPAEG
jgi:hypothetical protein